MLVSRGRGEDGTEFSPFASVLGPAKAERCQAGHVALPAPFNPPEFSFVKGVLWWKDENPAASRHPILTDPILLQEKWVELLRAADGHVVI